MPFFFLLVVNNLLRLTTQILEALFLQQTLTMYPITTRFLGFLPLEFVSMAADLRLPCGSTTRKSFSTSTPHRLSVMPLGPQYSLMGFGLLTETGCPGTAVDVRYCVLCRFGRTHLVSGPSRRIGAISGAVVLLKPCIGRAVAAHISEPAFFNVPVHFNVNKRGLPLRPPGATQPHATDA